MSIVDLRWAAMLMAFVVSGSLLGCQSPEMTTQVRNGGVTYEFKNGMYRAVSRGPGEIEFVGPNVSTDFTSRNGRLLRGGLVVGEVQPGDMVRIGNDGALDITSAESMAK